MDAKKIKGYLKARSLGIDGITFNDNYNQATYGLTMAEYSTINKAVNSEYGICIPSLNVAKVQKALLNK